MKERQGPWNILDITIQKSLGNFSRAFKVAIFLLGPGRKRETESYCLPRVQNLRNPAHGDPVSLQFK